MPGLPVLETRVPQTVGQVTGHEEPTLSPEVRALGRDRPLLPRLLGVSPLPFAGGPGWGRSVRVMGIPLRERQSTHLTTMGAPGVRRFGVPAGWGAVRL